MSTHLKITLWSAAAILGLSCGGNVVNAQQPATTAHTQVLSELHQAKGLLDHANHTYNGHRAVADHEISKAIHILHPHHKKSTAAPKVKTAAIAATAKPKHVHESQQASDTQLRQAEKLVRAALLELHKHKSEKAHAASKHLHHAIHEIEQAIHVHHKHHNKNALAKN